jgi:stearoyl-CoA desaturase (delta-9 desaturase)
MAPTNMIGASMLDTETYLDKHNNNEFNNNNYVLKQNLKNKNILNDSDSQKQPYVHKRKYAWRNIIAFIYLHCGFLYASYLIVTTGCLRTVFFAIIIGSCGGYGVTAGSHRLWAHKSYKAKLPLRILLMIFQTLAFQNHIYEWVRDHRVHHKFTDTDADPHDVRRGFFFAHMGWLCVKKHPEVKNKGRLVDMSDLEKDSVVMFQKKFYLILMPVISFLLPTIIPVYCWGESWNNAWYIAAIARYTWSLNVTWCINSFAHIVGMKPFDKNITPTDHPVTAIFTVGEGWHNYHHVFPWDYKTSELGTYAFNWTNAFIDFFAKIGWAYDLKTVSEEMIKKRVLRTGDGSHKWSQLKTTQEKLAALVNDPSRDTSEPLIWGWDDIDMSKEDKTDAKIIKKEL